MKRDPVLLFLFIGTIIFASLLIAVEKWFVNDGQIFQVFAGLTTGFSGAFFTRIKGPDRGEKGEKGDPGPQAQP